MSFLDRDTNIAFMRGDIAAVDFLEAIVSVLHFWDDLIDRDKAVAESEINAAFYTMLVSLPRNPFYMRHFDHLNPILVNAITNWHLANSMEHEGDDAALRCAFILRSSYVDLITQSALAVGGMDWARYVGAEIRRYAHKEGWDGYLVNLAAEKAARVKGLNHVL